MNDVIARALVKDILETLPAELASFYKNPPGRKPSKQTLKMNEIYLRIGDEDSLTMIRDVVDRTIVSIISLIDSDFKNLNIKTKFINLDGRETSSSGDLFEEYRSMSDPGGLLR